MGRGQIVSGGELGRYQVKLIYAYRNRITARLADYTQQIAMLDQKITAIDAQIAAESDPVKKAKLQDTRSVMVLQRASVQKLHDYYSTKMPADPTVDAWCADKTEDLAAGTNVGTIEIPGEPSTVLVRPAYDNRSVYTAARDGNIMPSIAGSPYQVLFNRMLLPGWQRHKPIYRAGTIVPDSLNFSTNTCSVCLDPEYSSQQNLPAVDGLSITNCNMGDDDQSAYLTSSTNDFCSRNPDHPLCTQSPGSEIMLTDEQLAQLQTVNYLVNGAHGRANDPSGIAAGDSWDVMGPGEAGDCEDFALTKMQMLVNQYGWNPNSLNIVTGFTSNGGYHAMLGVRTKNRGLVILDVNYDKVMESGRVPYRIDKIALASDDWRNYTRRLDNVPIEYMGCNAAAFADLDRVVVEFIGQKWTSPKVVGFIESPQPCMLGYAAFAIRYDWWVPNDVASWNDSGQTLKLEAQLTDVVGGQDVASSGLHAIQIAGYKVVHPAPPGGDFDFNDVVLALFLPSSSFEVRQSQNINAHMHTCFQQAGRAFLVLGNDMIGTGTLWQSYQTDAENYHYQTDTWSGNQDPGYNAYHPNAFSIGERSYVIDGEVHESNVQQKKDYSFITNSWISINDGGMALCRHFAFSVAGSGYVGLGYDDYYTEGERTSLGHYLGPPYTPENENYSYTNPTLRKYNPITDSWSFKTPLPSYPVGHYYPDGCDGQEGFGYVVGGWSPGDTSLNSYLDFYVATTDLWYNSFGPDIFLWRARACSINQ